MSITKVAVALLVAGLVVGIGIGYGLSFTMSQPEISKLRLNVKSLESQVSELTLQLDAKTKQVSDLISQLETKTKQLNGLQAELNEKEVEITNLQAQISSLNAEIKGLKKEIDDLNTQIRDLQNRITNFQSEIESLKALQLHEINFNWQFNEPLIGGYYVRVSGAVFNSGIYIAYNVRINIWLYDSNHILIKSDTISLGNIIGKTYVNFDTSIGYSGHCAFYSYEITHS